MAEGAGRAPVDTGNPAAGGSGLFRRLRRVPPPIRLFLAVLGLMALWYGVVGTMQAGIHVEPATRPDRADLPPGGSVAAGMAARLITLQVEERAFTPNDPIFYPTGLARRTPAFQEAVVGTLSAAVAAMAAASPSPDLAEAARDLQVDPALWWVRPAMPPVGRPAERHLLAGRESLRAYNRERQPAAVDRARTRLSPAATAVLAALLQQIDEQAARGDRVIRGVEEGSVSVQLARSRGTAHAAALILRGLREDDAAAIRLSGRASRWMEAQDALDRAAAADPLFAGADDLLHSGYSLLLAGNAIRAILGS